MKYFIFGLIVYAIGFPILNSLSEIIYNLSEAIKAKITIHIAKDNNTITQLSLPQEPTRAIGFSVETEEEEEDVND